MKLNFKITDQLKAFLPYLLLLICSLFPFWIISLIPKQSIYNFTDLGVPFNLETNFKDSLFAWNFKQGLGYPNYLNSIGMVLIYHLPMVAMIKIGLSVLSAQKIYFLAILFLAGAGMYFFLTHYFTSESKDTKANKISAFLASLFYMFNNSIGQRFIGVPHTAIIIVFFPFFLIILEWIINCQKNKSLFFYFALLSLIITIFLCSDFSLAYLFLGVGFVFVILNFLLNLRKLRKTNIFLGMLIVPLLVFLLNSFWILPSFLGFSQDKSGGSFKDIINSDINERFFEKNTFYHNSLLDFLRLHTGKNDFDSVSVLGENLYPKFIRDYFHLPFGNIWFYLLIAGGLLVVFSDKTNKKKVLIITSLGLLGIFFLFNAKAPMGFWSVHKFFFKYIFGFSSLRSFTKWQFVLVFWYSNLLYFLCRRLLEKSHKIYVKLIVILFVFLFIVQAGLPWFFPNYAGNFETFTLPQYYFDAKKWLDNQEGNFKFLILPEKSYSELYEWGPKFRPVHVYSYLFDKPAVVFWPIDATGGKEYIDPIENFEITNLPIYLKYLNVKYIILRKDLISASLDDRQRFEIENLPKCLEENGYKNIKTFGNKLFVYEVDNLSFSSPVYAAQKVNVFNGRSEEIKYLFNSEDSSESAVFLSNNDKNVPGMFKVFNNIILEVNQKNTSDQPSNYEVNIPVAGKYQILLRPSFTDQLISVNTNPMVDLGFFSLNIGGKEIQADLFKNYWWQFGNFPFLQGLTDFKINFKDVNLIKNEGWQKSITQAGDTEVIFQALNGWTSNYFYKVSLNYLTKSEGIDFSIIEKKIEETKAMFEYKQWEEAAINEHLISDNSGNKFEKIIKADPLVSNAVVAISLKKGVEAKITDILVSPIFQPKVFLKNEISNVSWQTPDINVEVVNPTRIEIGHNKIDKPFFLVLNESFHSGWKLQVGGKLIPEDKHFLANGFANAWYLEPKDFSEFSEEKIIINFYPQKLLNFGIYISLVAAGATVLILIVLSFKIKAKQ